MLFNSVEFFVFLTAVFCVYWRLPRRWQNGLLIVASYVFYGWWDPKFLSLIILSSAVDYAAGSKIHTAATPRARKQWLAVSLGTNLTLLGFFKYFGFFVESFGDVARALGAEPNLPLLEIVLPVGISFYTFQTLSYTIDIYRRRLEPCGSPLEFFAFVAFFPQLVAGPIERAKDLLPQFEADRAFSDAAARDGARQILCGLCKKVVIADNLAPLVDAAYANPDASGATLLLATLLFAFQIYCDFSGYSDIAIGTARLLGFRLTRNFAYPYFARNIVEFWRRWHISLSTWFRDYVYIPLGGSRVGSARYLRNITITFVVSGLWHGANWTFVAWGGLHASFFLAHWAYNKLRPPPPEPRAGWAGRLGRGASWALTFSWVTLAWVFFRADSVGHAVEILGRIATDTSWSEVLTLWPGSKALLLTLVLVEWIQRRHPHALEISRLPLAARWAIYYLLVTSVVLGARLEHVPFIYFQF